MHILEIPSFFPPNGGLFCLDQAKALKALGHEVRILSNVQLGYTVNKKSFFTLPFGRYEHEMDGITVCQTYQRGVPKLVRYNVSRWVSIVQSMYRDYEKHYGRPDILHAHCAKWAGYAAMLISREYGIPYVITEHLSKMIFEPEFGPAPSSAWQIPRLKESYKNANLVIPVSEELVDDISCYFGKDYRWTAVSNTIDVDFFGYRKRSPLAGRPFRFCCLANYWPLKGYEVLFAAFRKLREQGIDAELHVAGRGTDSPACIRQLPDGARSHGLLDRTAVRELLYDSDALVLASRSETQGLVLLEAMSTGVPAISTEAIPKSTRLDDGCVIVPVDDVEALAAAMQGVMYDYAKYDGEVMLQKVRALASPEVIGAKLTKLFSEVLASQ